MSLERLRCHLRRIPLPAHLGSDLESFTVDEVMGELSEFAPYDDSCEPLATEEEAADYTTKEFIAKKKRNNSFNQDIRERCQRMNGMVLSWNVDLYIFFQFQHTRR